VKTEVDGLVEELAASSKRTELIIFAGAGVSRASGLPLASQIIEHSLEAMLSASHLSEDYKALARSVVPRELRLEVFLRELMDVLGDRGLLPLTCLQNGQPTAMHRLTADLFGRGWLRGAVTTNFDLLFERACEEKSVHINSLTTDESYESWSQTKDQPSIFKLHGSLDEAMQAEVRQVARGLGRTRTAVLEHLLESYVFLFLGYSGRDFFGAMPVVFGSRFKRIVWVEHAPRGQAIQGNRVVKEWLNAQDRGTYIETDSGELLGALAQHLGLEYDVHAQPPAGPLVEPFAQERELLSACADTVVASLLKRAGEPSAAYQCYTTALNHLEMPAQNDLFIKCHLGCSNIALNGMEGWALEHTAMAHAEAALGASPGWGHPLHMQSQLAVYDAVISISVPSGFAFHSYPGLILSTQSIVDTAIANSEFLIAAAGCRLLGQIIVNGKNTPGSLNAVISLYEDTVVFQEVEHAQDLLASTYWWLSMLNARAGNVEEALKYNVKRLKSLLLIRQTPDHEHILTCVKMIQRELAMVGRETAAGREAIDAVARLGYSA
jgi:hypothetical protein